MYYVGIDVAQKKHYVCILDDQAEFVVKPFWIYSDILGLMELIKRFTTISLNNDDFIIGVESTGALSENLYEYITDSDYKVILLNAYQTAKFRDFSTLKKVKNDAIDAYVIAELLQTGKYKESHISDDDYHSLKVLGRLKHSLDDKTKNIKREISTVIATVNPEITRVFPNIFTKTAIVTINAYPTAMDLQTITPKKLTKLFRHIKGNNFNEDKAQFLIDLAHTSIYTGRAQEARSIMIRTNLKLLALVSQEKSDIEKQIQDLIETKLDNDACPSPIDNVKTIPGVSDKTVVALLGECGDLKRFTSAKSFIGYLGLYPTQYQSGNTDSHGRLAQRGIPIAKHALYMAAVSSVRHNDQLKKLFFDKVSSGKSKKEALIIISKKLATMIYSIFKYNKPYEPNRVLVR